MRFPIRSNRRLRLDRRLVLVVIATLALVIGLLATVTVVHAPAARADGRYGGLYGSSLAYDHGPVGVKTVVDGLENDAPNGSQPDWMSWVNGNVKLNRLSIPGTHDSFAYHGGPSPRTQGLCGSVDPEETQACDITAQLNAGIRYFDVRAQCRHDDGVDKLKIYHGPVSQYGDVKEDFLIPLKNWLTAHPTEAVIARLSRDGTSNLKYPVDDFFDDWESDETTVADTCTDTRDEDRSIDHMVQGYYDDPDLSGLFWTGPEDGSQPIPSPKNAPPSVIPTLDQARKHLVLFDSFRDGDDPIYGWDFRNDDADNTHCCQYDENASTFEDLDEHWQAAQDHFEKADTALAGDSRSYWVTDMSGSAGLTPAEIAYGNGALAPGMDWQALRFFFKGGVDRAGIAQMDFPGAGLISAIIGLNLRDAVPSAAHLKGSFSDLAHSLIRSANPGDESGDATDAVCFTAGCSTRTGYFEHAAPGLHVHTLGFKGQVAVGFTPLYGWSHNDASDGYGAYVFNTPPSDPAMPFATVESAADSVLADITSGELTDRLSRLLSGLQAKYPGVVWYTAAKPNDPDRDEFDADTGYLKGEWHGVSYWIAAFKAPAGVLKDLQITSSITDNGQPVMYRGSTSKAYAIMSFDTGVTGSKPTATASFTKDGVTIPGCESVPMTVYNRYDRYYATCDIDTPADTGAATGFDLGVTVDAGDWKDADGHDLSGTSHVTYVEPHVYNGDSTTQLTLDTREFDLQSYGSVKVIRDEDGKRQLLSGTWTLSVDGVPVEHCDEVPVGTNGCPIWFVTPGAHLVRVTFSGNESGSLAPSETQQMVNVPKAAVKIDPQSSSTSVVDNQQVTFDATMSLARAPGFESLPVNPNLGDITGSVSFRSPQAQPGCETVPVVNGHASCVATADLKSLHDSSGPVSSFRMIATYWGNDQYFGYTADQPGDPVITVTVAKAPTETRVSAVPVTVGGVPTYRFTATTFAKAPASGGYASGGTSDRTSFSINGTPYAACAAQPGDVAGAAVCDVPVSAFTGAPSFTVAATRPDGIEYLGSTGSIKLRATTVFLTLDHATSTYGQAVVATAKVGNNLGDGAPTGQVQFFLGTTLLKTATLVDAPGGTAVAQASLGIRSVGTRTVTAKYLGIVENRFLPSSAATDSTVMKKALTITASSGSFNYGGTVPTITPSYSGLITGESASNLTTAPTCDTTATSTSAVGSYSSSCHGGVSSNYAISYAGGTVQVLPAALSLSVNGSIPYGGGPTSYEVTGNAFVNGDDVGDLNGTLTCTASVPSAAPAGSSVAFGPCSGLTSPNYAITIHAGTITVVKRTLTVWPDDVTREFGQPNALTYKFAGFANNDGSSVVSGQPTLSTTATPTSPVGVYPITAILGTLSAQNYTFAFNTGTLTVVPAPLTTTVSGSQTYGSSSPTFAASGALPAGVTRSGTPSCTKVTSGAFINAALAAGSYAVDPGTCSGVSLGGTQAGNYRLVLGGGPFTVAKAPVVVTTSSTSSLLSLLTFRIAYTSQVVNAVNGQPVPGVTVTTRIDGAAATSGCTAVTNAQGVATCASSRVNIVLGSGIPYTATAAEGPNTKAGVGSGKIPLL